MGGEGGIGGVYATLLARFISDPSAQTNAKMPKPRPLYQSTNDGFGTSLWFWDVGHYIVMYKIDFQPLQSWLYPRASTPRGVDAAMDTYAHCAVARAWVACCFSSEFMSRKV